MSPIQGDLETGRPRLSTMSFIDPQHDADRQHVAVRATQPRPLPRELRLLRAEIPGAGSTRDLGQWVVDTHTTALLVLDGPLGQGNGRARVVRRRASTPTRCCWAPR